MKLACRLLVVGLLLAVAGCASAAGTSAQPPKRELTVFAASSLTEVFGALGDRFEAKHPGVTVKFSFESSATLAEQIAQGAPADVFAAASPKTMATVTDAGLAPKRPPVFVRNRLQIAVPAGNPGKVHELKDLAKPGLKVALCAEQVPCGAAAVTALAAGGVKVTPDTYEKDVKAVMSKLTLGEVDAALVYHTDVVAAAGDKVEGIEFPEARKAINDYPIAVLRDAPQRSLARQFVEYVRSSTGRTALARAGFELP